MKYNIENWPAQHVRRPIIVDFEEELAFLDSLSGALIGASTAGNADVSVDDVLAVAFGDSLNGALVGAGAAGDTSVSNSVSHDKPP